MSARKNKHLQHPSSLVDVLVHRSDGEGGMR